MHITTVDSKINRTTIIVRTQTELTFDTYDKLTTDGKNPLDKITLGDGHLDEKFDCTPNLM